MMIKVIRLKEDKIKKILFFVLILVYAASFSFGQKRKFQVSLFSGINHVFEGGSEDDYVAGENDFPVTPAHAPLSFGAAFAYFLTKNIGIELEGRYTLSSKVTLEDPSDQDTVEINTSKHYSITLNLIYQFLRGSIRPYLVVGGGIDEISAKDETYTSEYGYEIEFLAPEKKMDPLVKVGAGIHYFISPCLGARVDLRYVLIFDDPDNVNSLVFVAGAFFRF